MCSKILKKHEFNEESMEDIFKNNQMKLPAMKHTISEMKCKWIEFKANWTLQRKNK